MLHFTFNYTYESFNYGFGRTGESAHIFTKDLNYAALYYLCGV